MKILYHHRTLGDGAEGIHIAEIVHSLRKVGHVVHMVCPGGKEPRPPGSPVEQQPAPQMTPPAAPSSASLLERIKNLLPKFTFRLAEIAYNLISFTKVFFAIGRFRPDFIYERYACFSCGGILAARMRGVPVLLEVNTPYAVAWSLYDKLYFKRTALWIENFVLRKADVIFTVSTALKDILKDRSIPADKIVVTPNAINAEQLRRFQPGNLRQKLGLSGKRVVGFVGSLRKWHGVDLLIEIIPGIARQCADSHFLIVGDGELRSEFESAMKSAGVAGHVTFTGRVPHASVFDYIAAMDIALMPNSNAYGSPMKIFEYMALERAIIAPDLGPLAEVMQHGKDGLLVKSGDPSMLKSAIITLIGDPELCRSLGASAKARVFSQFTWDQNARTILAEYSRLHRQNPAVPEPSASELRSPSIANQ